MKKKIIKIISIIFMITLVLSYGFTIYTLLLLKSIETFYRIMGLILLGLIVITFIHTIRLSLRKNKKKLLIVFIILSVLLSASMVTASYFIYNTYKKIDNFNKDTITYKTVLLSLEDGLELKDIKDKTIGVLSDTDDITGYILPFEVITENKLDKNNEIKKYSDTMTLIDAFLKKEVDLIFISNSYQSMFNNSDSYDQSTTTLYEVYTYSEEYKKSEINQDEEEEKTSKSVTEPFTILLLGVDGTEDNVSSTSSYNGDTIMFISVDPETLNATMFSIPRDTYTKMACGGNITKINAAAWGGTYCMVKTVENFTGLDVDYYALINFKGVVNLVNALGGIDVDVPMDFCEQDSNRQWGENEICLKTGMQHLDGEAALALCRHRKTLALGDFQRGQNQQLVLEAIIEKLKTVRSVNDFTAILDTISNNLDTDMTTEEILSLYNVGKNVLLKSDDVQINITKTFLTGYSLMVNVGYGYTYTFQPYKQSLNSIVTAMKQNLGMVEKEEIKTFSFDINNLYEKEIIGYKYYTDEAQVELFPDFSTYSLSEVKSWATKRGFDLTVEEVEATSENQEIGDIIYQSIEEGYLVEGSSKKLTVKVVNKLKTTTKITEDKKTTTDDEDEDEKEETKEEDNKETEETASGTEEQEN